MSVNLGYNIEDALKREDISRQVLDDLRSANVANMPDNLTDRQILLFYMACDKNFDTAKNCIAKYYSHKLGATEHFTNRDPQSSQIQQCLKNQ